MQGIKHLIINSPYEEARRHWEYNHNRMAFELAEGRRPSGYTVASTEKRLINDPGVFVQIPLVNKIRQRVKEWREDGYAGVSGITKQLLEHWRDKEERTDRFFYGERYDLRAGCPKRQRRKKSVSRFLPTAANYRASARKWRRARARLS